MLRLTSFPLLLLSLGAWSAPISPEGRQLSVKVVQVSSSASATPSASSKSSPELQDPGTHAQGVLYYRPAAALATQSLSSELASSPSSPPTSLSSIYSSSVSSAAASHSSSTAASAPSTSSELSSTSSTNPKVIAYYTAWSLWQLAPEQIAYQNYDILNFAFAIPNEKFELTWSDPNSDPSTLRRLVDGAKSRNTKVLLSIGGWTGSKYFSPAMATEASRATFVSNILATYQEFQLAGIDIDWEYPNHQGEGSNLMSSLDTSNFLLFLRLLRSALPSDALITAAVSTTPFADEMGRPSSDVRGFNEVLDWITLMVYDAFGASSNPGPNAPLSDACNNSTQPQANAVSAFDSWTKAGMSSEKVVLGIASYGYHSSSSATTLRTRSLPLDALHPRDEDGGQVTFNSLIKQGKLIKSNNTASTMYEAGPGYTLSWDYCSSTPFLYTNLPPTSMTSTSAAPSSTPAQPNQPYQAPSEVITFDSPESLAMKTRWVREVGMGGVNMWSLDGDTSEGVLVDAIRKALGRNSN